MSLGPTITRLTRIERDQYVAIAAWCRRRTLLEPGQRPLPYAALATPILWIFVVVSAVELTVVHVLLHPWPVPRWIAFALGLWGLVWMIGFLAAYRTRPHGLGPTTLHLHAGVAATVTVPLDAVDTVTVRDRDLASSARLSTLEDDETGTWCGLGVSGRTNVQVTLGRPLTIERPGLTATGTVDVTSVGFWVDEPRTAAALVRDLLPQS